MTRIDNMCVARTDQGKPCPYPAKDGLYCQSHEDQERSMRRQYRAKFGSTLAQDGKRSDEYHQLLGLFTVAASAMDRIAEIEAAAAAILGVANEGGGYYGHVSDAIYGMEGSPKARLDRLLGLVTPSEEPSDG